MMIIPFVGVASANGGWVTEFPAAAQHRSAGIVAGVQPLVADLPQLRGNKNSTL